jgi:hypothetical protein
MHVKELKDRHLAEWVTHCRMLAQSARTDAHRAAAYDALINALDAAADGAAEAGGTTCTR